LEIRKFAVDIGTPENTLTRVGLRAFHSFTNGEGFHKNRFKFSTEKEPEGGT